MTQRNLSKFYEKETCNIFFSLKRNMRKQTLPIFINEKNMYLMRPKHENTQYKLLLTRPKSFKI